MLRFFQIDSDAISYDGDYEADVTFPAETAEPAAIIGVEAIGTSREYALRNEISEWKVASRKYVAGDPFPLGLLMPMAPGSASAVGRAYFPGSAIPLPGGGSAGAILMRPNEHVQIRIKDLSAGSAPLTQLVLLCVEFTRNCPNAEALKAIYRQLERGNGEIYFTGNKQAYDTAANYKLSTQPKPPNRTSIIRRIAVRGAGLVTAGAAVAESDFALTKAQLYTNSNRAPHNAATPARAIIGSGAHEIPGSGMVDMKNGGHALIELTVPTPAASRTACLLSIFEGREGGEMLDTSRAIS